MSRTREVATLCVLMLALGLGLSACSGSKSASQEKDVKAAPTSATAATSGQLPVTFKGTTVTPSGKLVQAKLGKPFSLFITADKAGQMHVHSTPEQHIDYPAGHSVVTVTFHQPGVVEIESHTLNKQIVQVQVR